MVIKKSTIFISILAAFIMFSGISFCAGKKAGRAAQEKIDNIVIDSVAKKKDTITITTINHTTVHDTVYKVKVKIRTTQHDSFINITRYVEDTLKLTVIKDSFIVRPCDSVIHKFTIDTVFTNGIHLKNTIITFSNLLSNQYTVIPAYIKPVLESQYSITGYIGTSIGVNLQVKNYNLLMLKSITSKQYQVLVGYSLKF